MILRIKLIDAVLLLLDLVLPLCPVAIQGFDFRLQPGSLSGVA